MNQQQPTRTTTKLAAERLVALLVKKAQFQLPQPAKTIAPNAGKNAFKTIAQGALKKVLPGAGAAISLYDAKNKFKNKDYLGAGIDTLTGIASGASAFPLAAPIAAPIAMGLGTLGLARDAYHGIQNASSNQSSPAQPNPVDPVTTVVNSAGGPGKPPVDSGYSGSGADFGDTTQPPASMLAQAQPDAQSNPPNPAPAAQQAAPEQPASPSQESSPTPENGTGGVLTPALAGGAAGHALRRPTDASTGDNAPAQPAAPASTTQQTAPTQPEIQADPVKLEANTPATPEASSAGSSSGLSPEQILKNRTIENVKRQRDRAYQAAGVDPNNPPANFSGYAPPSNEQQELNAPAPASSQPAPPAPASSQPVPPAPATQQASPAPASQQSQNTGTYNQAIQQLLKTNPALGQAGSEDNTRFINDLKSQFGENYKSVLQNDPSKLTEIANKYQAPAAPQQAPAAPAKQPYTPSHYERGAQVLSQGIRNGTITPAQAQASLARMPEAERQRASMIMAGGSPESVNAYMTPKTGELNSRMYKLAGFIDMLEKEGANEDFILGFLKEAELTYTDLPEDRHRILPFMNNQMTGAIGGAMLGNLVGNELDLDGVPGMLLPIMGAYAGYSHLPSLMNKFKDPAGQGANAIHPAVSNFVNARNFGPEPGSPNFVGPTLPEPPESQTQPAYNPGASNASPQQPVPSVLK